MRGWVSIGVAAAVLLVLAAWLYSAIAHDWYPMECCHAQDCAPVDKVEVQSIPALAQAFAPLPSQTTVTTRHGSTVVPTDFQPRQSPDGRMHACIRQGRLICLFLPPSM